MLDEPLSAQPPSNAPRPIIRMAVGILLLASAAILTVLACLTSTSRWACTSGGPWPHCGDEVSIGPISYGPWPVLDPYVQAAIVPPLWIAGILLLRRYHGWTYALAPIAGVVAIMIFAQGRYNWGWEHNWFAFLACVLGPTAACVLIARSINRTVRAREAEAAAYRQRKEARLQRMSATFPPPGWYPDPGGDPRWLRQWNGRQWTGEWRYAEQPPWTSPPS